MTNEVLKVIQKSITDLETSVDKQLVELKPAVDQGNANVASPITTFSEFEDHLDVTEVRVGEVKTKQLQMTKT